MMQDPARKGNPLGMAVDIVIGLFVVTLAHLVLVASDKGAWIASRVSQVPVEKQGGLVPLIADIITAVPTFATPYIASAGCMIAIASCNATLGWRPILLTHVRTVGGALMMSILFASVLTGACDYLAGIHERIFGADTFAYESGGRVAVFCMGLLAAASCLMCSGLVLDLTRRGPVLAKEIFGHDAFPARAIRMQLWTLLLLLGLAALVAALAWVMAYFPSRVPKDMAPSLLSVGLPPLHVPFSWAADLLGFDRVHAYVLSVVISTFMVWGAAKVAMPSLTADRASEPCTVEA